MRAFIDSFTRSPARNLYRASINLQYSIIGKRGIIPRSSKGESIFIIANLLKRGIKITM